MSEHLCIIGVGLLVVLRTDCLSGRDMEGFGLYLTMDLAERSGQRGRRQKQPMVGMFVTWPVAIAIRPQQSAAVKGATHFDAAKRTLHLRRFRGSDFSLRVALLVHGWCKTGFPDVSSRAKLDRSVLRVAAHVAEEYGPFLRLRLDKGRRGKRSYNGGTEVDETVRTVYYKFSARFRALDVLLEMWFWNYIHWCDWVKSVDGRGIELTVRDYAKRGQPENARAFRAFADRIRRNGSPWNPAVGWPYRRIPLGRGDDISANVAVSSLPL